jgi:uncharacterized protein YecE (DUF72 family)
MGWSYRFWVGKLYPEGAKPTGYLAEYAKAMNSVEIDATFYRIPSVSTVEAWRDSVPQGFRFAAKFPQAVTHAPGLAYDAEKLGVFIRHMDAMGSRLGPMLLQFPPFLKPEHKALGDLLGALPRGLLVAAEFRNRGWFTGETYKLLRDHGVALASTNRAGAPEEDTASFAYFRWEGDRKMVVAERGEAQVDKAAETTEWAVKVKRHLKEGRDVYGYFSKYYSGYPPGDVETLVKSVE